MTKEVSGFPKLPAIESIGDGEEWLLSVQKFNEDNKDGFAFGSRDVSERCEFTNQLLRIIDFGLKKENVPDGIEDCLSALVVMSRDRLSVSGRFSSEETWKNLVAYAGLKTDGRNLPLLPISVKIYACKCLCNIIFLTNDCKGLCNDNGLVKSIMNCVKDPDANVSDKNGIELEFLNLRLLFLISVFSTEARERIRDDHGGLRILIDNLNKKLQRCKEADHKTPCFRGTLSVLDARSCSEILKTIFNLNIKARKEETSQVQEEAVVEEFKDLTTICRKCLLILVDDDPVSTTRLHTDAQNALYSIPSSCFYESYLIPTRSEQNSDGVLRYEKEDMPLSVENRDVSAILGILKYIEQKIASKKLTTENLQPVLSLLSHLSRSSRCIRKFCKDYVIPPRKNFENPPEVGVEFRNKLIKLFTNTNTEVKASAADFIFVLCKEKVDRLVKYTGYGNAAGLLANRGLLAGGRGDTLYSDSDSDSDTEEYKENMDKINPVTGHIPPDMPDPMEGMTDEQKEYLAMQLANQLSKLSEDDTLKPMCVDPNTGKLVSFQQRVHETELPVEKDSDDSDSD